MDAWTGILEQRLAQLPCRVALEWPGGRAGPLPAEVRLTLRAARWVGSLARGQLGALGDAYVQGHLDIEGRMRDVMQVAARLVRNPVRQQAPRPWLRCWQHLRSLRRHRQEQDARQVQFHYDVSDDFYALWLDPRRVYSCAYYAAADMSLAQAQEAKLEHICRKLQLRPGLRLLDIGAGWGGLLLWAAEHHGVEAVGITLSHNQAEHVRRLIDARGLAGRVEVHLMDYRDLPETQGFDRIASVGMCEHVGRAKLPGYFAKIARLLKPGGLLLNHGITSGGLHHHQLDAGMGDFIERYIFPGGELAHVSRLAQCLGGAGLELLDAENLRPHYARTLWDWSDGLEAHLDEARAVTDERTVRAYRLYLAGCAMCFERGWISLYQLLASRPSGSETDGPMRGAQCDFPFNRSYMYG
ncbi:class I SAM-dependent methyltransferase [Aquabacterium sp. A7-Y]|uniref:class I SAM-dependent methyltransferase n=1 Tax=Aquabacterium sp. A7-Y TaxID=1349605 RepID=UPI00223D8B02|nr:class I SAM-dependent methyltransferase [Aquabacterium sp. A7-Y]MCW7539856.1 class I SAM-dependent methyltransferase [Aquabacterium sp. A7-Y]